MNKAYAILALACSWSFAACGGAAGSASSAPPAAGRSASASGKPSTAAAAPEHLKFSSTTGSLTASGVYIAIERGYFNEAGVDVEIVPFGGGAQMISSIAASQVDAGNTDAGAGLLNAISRELPMRFVADGSHCNADHCGTAFAVRKDLVDSGKFKGLNDLKGMSLNVFTPGSTLYQYTNRMLDNAGLKAGDVKTQAISNFTDVLPAFSNKALDGSWLIEPFTTQGIAQGLITRYRTAAELFGPQQNTVIVFAPTFATQRQEAGKKFMVGYLRGIRDYIDAVDKGKDYEEIVGILVKSSSLKDAALYKKIGLPGFNPNGQLLLDAIKTNQQWYVEHGDVKTPVDIDRVYDGQYLDYALGVVGRR